MQKSKQEEIAIGDLQKGKPIVHLETDEEPSAHIQRHWEGLKFYIVSRPCHKSQLHELWNSWSNIYINHYEHPTLFNTEPGRDFAIIPS